MTANPLIPRQIHHLVGQLGTIPDILPRDEIQVFRLTLQDRLVFVRQDQPIQRFTHFIQLSAIEERKAPASADPHRTNNSRPVRASTHIPINPIPALPNILHLMLERLDDPRSDLTGQSNSTACSHLGRPSGLRVVRWGWEGGELHLAEQTEVCQWLVLFSPSAAG